METSIIPIGNSKGVRLPAAFLRKLDSNRVTLRQGEDGTIEIKPVRRVIPRSEWAAILEKLDCSPEASFEDWDVTLADGLNDEEAQSIQKVGRSSRGPKSRARKRDKQG